jgi:uncharacterized phage protein (TIGR02220 family)
MENVKTITLNIDAITDDLDNELLGKAFKSIVADLRKQDILVDDCRVELLLSKINAKEVKKNTTEIDWDRLIAYFNKVFKKSARIISDDAKKKFRQRLKDGYTKDDIQKVIDNCSNDNHHKDNDYKYVTFEFLSRPAIFERYAAMEHKKPQSLNQGHNNH